MGTSFLALDECGCVIFHTVLKKHKKILKTLKKNTLVKKKKVAFPLIYSLIVIAVLKKTKKTQKNQDAKCSRCSNYGGQSRPHYKPRCPRSKCSWKWSTSSARSSPTQSKWGFVPYGLSLRRRFGQGCH